VISIENEVYRSRKVSEIMGYNIRPKGNNNGELKSEKFTVK
jgi:hypothetical protein